MLVAKLKTATALLLAASLLGAGAAAIAGQMPTVEPVHSAKTISEPIQDKIPTPAPLLADLATGPPDTPDDHPTDLKADAPQSQEGNSREKQHEPPKDDDDDDDLKNLGVVKRVDPSRNTVTLTVRRKGKNVDQTFDLARNVEVVIADRAGRLGDLKAGMEVALKLSKDKKKVVAIKEVNTPQNKDSIPRNRQGERKRTDDD